MENISNTHSHKKHSTPAYLREIDKMIQNHRNLIKKRTFSENSDNSKQTSDIIFSLKKNCMKVLSYINEAKLIDSTNEIEIVIENYLQQMREFSSLFVKPKSFLDDTILDQSYLNLITSTNKIIEERYNERLEKSKYFENMDLKSIKKLQYIYQESFPKDNHKVNPNFLAQMSPLIRELSFICEKLESKQLKLSEKENTYKFNNAKVTTYKKELASTTEKYQKTFDEQNILENEYMQLLTEKNSIENELIYMQENLTEKLTKNGKKILIYKFKDTDNKAKKIILNNLLCHQEIEKGQMLKFDLCKCVKFLTTESLNSLKKKEAARKLFFQTFSLKILQNKYEKAKLSVEKLEEENRLLKEILPEYEHILNFNKNFEEKNIEKNKDQAYLFNIQKRTNKYKSLYEKMISPKILT